MPRVGNEPTPVSDGRFASPSEAEEALTSPLHSRRVVSMLTGSQLRSNLSTLEQDDRLTNAPQEIKDLVLDGLTVNEKVVLSLTSKSHAKVKRTDSNEDARKRAVSCLGKNARCYL